VGRVGIKAGRKRERGRDFLLLTSLYNIRNENKRVKVGRGMSTSYFLNYSYRMKRKKKMDEE